MKILAIDPGCTQSAYVIYDGTGATEFGKVGNDEMLSRVVDAALNGEVGELVIEQVACMGMAVGAEVFETVFWSGRFCEASDRFGVAWSRVKRHEVKTHLCGNQRAKDPNIRQALLDRFGPGKELAVGTKKSPGPLYGVAGDVWSALAVAVTYADRTVAA